MVKKASNPSKEYRSFVLEGSSIGFEGAQFVSASPGGAASKAGNKLFRLIAKDSGYARFKRDEVVQFIIREITKGSSGKIYAYDARKEKLDTPVERKFPAKNGETNIVVITDKIKVKALKEHEVHSSLQKHL